MKKILLSVVAAAAAFTLALAPAASAAVVDQASFESFYSQGMTAASTSLAQAPAVRFVSSMSGRLIHGIQNADGSSLFTVPMGRTSVKQLCLSKDDCYVTYSAGVRPRWLRDNLWHPIPAGTGMSVRGVNSTMLDVFGKLPEGDAVTYQVTGSSGSLKYSMFQDSSVRYTVSFHTNGGYRISKVDSSMTDIERLRLEARPVTPSVYTLTPSQIGSPIPNERVFTVVVELPGM